MNRFMFIACAAAFVLPTSLLAQTTTGGSGGDLSTMVMRVEEDWEAVLLEPDLDLTAPQFHTIMSPYGGTDGLHFQTSWNYRDINGFISGGLQTVAWDGDFENTSKAFRDDSVSNAAETIRWTQVLRTTGGTLNFRIKDGTSQTWGAFGGSESRISLTASVPNLDGYRPGTSVANSWISYGENRVMLLRIREARGYDADGNLVVHDQTSRVVFQQSN